MAFDFSKLNFFNRLDARARIFVLIAGVAVIIFIVYLGTRYFFGGEETAGPSRVAAPPGGLESVPGGTLTAEYQQALEQASEQRAQQAQLSGGSALPTQISVTQAPQTTAGCIICTDQAADVKYLLDDWTKQGKVSPDVANALQQLADKNVSVDEYAAELDRLVKEGKLTPEQARQLLEQYKKQHANRLLDESAKGMDALIKAGQLPLDVANQLLDAQKKKMTPAEYAAMLQELVRQGKISPAVAQQLLAQYTQQRAKQIIMQSIASLRRMAKQGQITADVEKALIDLENAMVPVDAYSATLQRYLSQGKLVPAVATAILDEYKSQKAAIGPTASVDQMLQKAEAAAYGEINDLMQAGKMTREVGAQLAGMIQSNVALDAYKAAVSQLVQQKKLTPEIAKLKIADYEKVKGLREVSQRLATLQGNNAPLSSFEDELKRGVAAGIITPEQAAQLLQEYQATLGRAAAPGAAPTATTEEFARLQQRAQEAGPAVGPAATADEFAAAQERAELQAAQDRQGRIQALMDAMSGQAQQLVASWQPAVMSHKEGSPPETDAEKRGAARAGDKQGEAQLGTDGAVLTGPPLIKSGTILFAVLDTAVNSDYPDSPVMATIVDGKYKGARLLGKLQTTKGVAGQMDRVSLTFTLMDMEAWPKSKTVNAFAIDPDTARTVMASSVNYHYLQRYGAIMATSFLQGYATAITNAGTSTTGIFGTSTTHAELSPTSKLAVALGQIGQNLGTVTQNYINIPPTVKVDSGVGLGILFMADVAS